MKVYCLSALPPTLSLPPSSDTTTLGERKFCRAGESFAEQGQVSETWGRLCGQSLQSFWSSATACLGWRGEKRRLSWWKQQQNKKITKELLVKAGGRILLYKNLKWVHFWFNYKSALRVTQLEKSWNFVSLIYVRNLQWIFITVVQ